MHFVLLLQSPAKCILLVMANVSIFQPAERPASSGLILLPHTFVTLKGLDTSAASFLPALRRFLEDRHALRELSGLAAAEVADFLDEVRKPIGVTASSHGRRTLPQLIIKLDASPEFRRRTIRVLRHLCGSWGVLPASYTLQGEVEVTDRTPWTCAGFSEVWRGTWGCERVAVKVIKVTGTSDPRKLKKARTITQI